MTLRLCFVPLRTVREFAVTCRASGRSTMCASRSSERRTSRPKQSVLFSDAIAIPADASARTDTAEAVVGDSRSSVERQPVRVFLASLEVARIHASLGRVRPSAG